MTETVICRCGVGDVTSYNCVAAPVTNQPVTPKALTAGQNRPHPPHIPSHFPEFPDPHTYIKTPVSSRAAQGLCVCESQSMKVAGESAEGSLKTVLQGCQLVMGHGSSPALRRLRQNGCYAFEASLCYRVKCFLTKRDGRGRTQSKAI